MDITVESTEKNNEQNALKKESTEENVEESAAEKKVLATREAAVAEILMLRKKLRKKAPKKAFSQKPNTC